MALERSAAPVTHMAAGEPLGLQKPAGHERNVSRNSLNIITNLISALSLLGLAMAGLVLRYVLPPGAARGRCGP